RLLEQRLERREVALEAVLDVGQEFRCTVPEHLRIVDVAAPELGPALDERLVADAHGEPLEFVAPRLEDEVVVGQLAVDQAEEQGVHVMPEFVAECGDVAVPREADRPRPGLVEPEHAPHEAAGAEATDADLDLEALLDPALDVGRPRRGLCRPADDGTGVRQPLGREPADPGRELAFGECLGLQLCPPGQQRRAGFGWLWWSRRPQVERSTFADPRAASAFPWLDFALGRLYRADRA